MRVLTVLGTRPEIIRLSRVIPLLDAATEHVLVHTGQNSSQNLSGIFFREMEVREPDEYLGVDTSSLGRQLATLFQGIEDVLDRVRPDRLLLLGDTNSALVAVIAKRRGIQVFHMEAGNRCYDDRVPEEINRRIVDHCSSVLLPYTDRSAENLVREGIERHRIFVTGNPIFEVLQHYEPAIAASDALSRYDVEAGKFLLATMHRAENTDDRAVFAGLCTALCEVADLYALPLVLSVHPRIEALLGGDLFGRSRVRPVPAMSFFEFIALQRHAALVLTDSGTVQEECAILRVPVITIRDTTERPETVEAGSNLVASTAPDAIVRAARFLQHQPPRGLWTPPQGYTTNHVSSTVVRLLLSNSGGAHLSAFSPGPGRDAQR